MSMLGISFLNEIAHFASFNKGVSLFFVDEDGTVIGHTNKSMVIKQINLKHSNVAVKKAMSGKSGTEISKIYGEKYIVAYRPLHHFDAIDNPKWAVVLIANMNDFTGQGGNLMSASLIVLAVLALYVLFYILRYLMSLISEGHKNDI